MIFKLPDGSQFRTSPVEAGFHDERQKSYGAEARTQLDKSRDKPS